MPEGYVTIKALSIEAMINADTLRTALATTPRRQHYGQALIDRRKAIREAAETFERLAAENSRIDFLNGSRGGIYRVRADRFMGYARRLRELENKDAERSGEESRNGAGK